MKSHIIKCLEKDKHDLNESLKEIVSYAEKLKNMVMVSQDAKECQTEVSGNILTKEENEELLKESQLECQKLTDQSRLFQAKEKAFLSKFSFNNIYRINK